MIRELLAKHEFIVCRHGSQLVTGGLDHFEVAGLKRRQSPGEQGTAAGGFAQQGGWNDDWHGDGSAGGWGWVLVLMVVVVVVLSVGVSLLNNSNIVIIMTLRVI